MHIISSQGYSAPDQQRYNIVPEDIPGRLAQSPQKASRYSAASMLWVHSQRDQLHLIGY